MTPNLKPTLAASISRFLSDLQRNWRGFLTTLAGAALFFTAITGKGWQ